MPSWRRHRALRESFPESWRLLLSERMAHWRYLDDSERSRLEDLIRVFLAEKRFEGAGGFRVTDDVRLTIAAGACLLLLGLDHHLYRDVTTVIVYPSTMERPGPRASPLLAGAVAESPVPLVGEARMHGPVMIVWDAARAQARHPERGHNVVYHEFAHKIDMADGSADGTPRLHDAEQYERWVRVCSREFERVRAAAEAGRHHGVLDDYAGVNPAEFFAVATEAFFDVPVTLRRDRSELYKVLSEFYRQDPAERLQRRAGSRD